MHNAKSCLSLCFVLKDINYAFQRSSRKCCCLMHSIFQGKGGTKDLLTQTVQPSFTERHTSSVGLVIAGHFSSSFSNWLQAILFIVSTATETYKINSWYFSFQIQMRNEKTYISWSKNNIETFKDEYKQ